MSLYKKYRPKAFDEIKGNKATLEALQNMLQKEEMPHSFLFTGPTGCGKTTIGRILAKELDCIDDDLKEINTADFRGIDSARDIIQKAQFMPLNGKSRGWIIDECHKLTGDAQNALLKILEDTPDHVYFILCTTDPQKLIPTIKNRCQTFQMELLSDIQMLKLLKQVTKAEGEVVEKEIFEQIILDSLGHARNALQILEQVLNTDPEKRLEIAKKTAEQQSEMIELCRALIGRKGWSTINKILTGLKGQDPESIRRVVLGYAQAVLLKSDNELAGLILEEFMEPTYNSGFPQVVYACYSITKG